MNKFKVIVAGSRTFNNYELLKEKLDMYLSRVKDDYQVVIVSGKAKGADSLGERYAYERAYDVDEFPAKWDEFGKSAGYIRNREMAQNANACIAFWDGDSNGTRHMIDLAREHQLQLKILYTK